MLKVITVMFLLFFMFPVPSPANDDLSDVLEGIRKNYGSLPGLSLSYSREVITKSMSLLRDQAKGDLATGSMYFKPPYFLRMSQNTPKPETVIANEETLWWYIPDKNRAYKYSALEFGQELRLLSDIFRGLIKVEERFQLALLNPNEQGEKQIELRPNPPWQNIDRIGITVTKANEIRIVGIHYQLGGVTLFTLNNVTAKEDFEKDLFEFVVPEGVQVVEEKNSL